MDHIEDPHFKDWSRWWLLGIIGGVLSVGALAAYRFAYGVIGAIVVGSIIALVYLRRWWSYVLWVDIWGLVLLSYGFNNVPIPYTPIPLADVLALYALVGSFPLWKRLAFLPENKPLLWTLVALSLWGVLRLIVDVPRYGILAGRDALFIFELWTVFAAMALGSTIGKERLRKVLLWLFCAATGWFLFYPVRETLIQWSPLVGIRRPEHLVAFTTAGFVSVVAFFFFLQYRNRIVSILGLAATLVILLMVQSRGAYLALFLTLVALLVLQPRYWLRSAQRLVVSGIILLLLLPFLGKLQGRLGRPVGIHTAAEQLQTLAGEQGPGAGSFHHRLRAWPAVVRTVLDEPLGPIIGVGFGVDLFQGFTVKSGVLVRKPHNDFLEIWARMGVLGIIPWLVFLVWLMIRALRGVRIDPRDGWVLALQIMLWITAVSEPAMGFAYITVVWVGLTGMWLGTWYDNRKSSESSMA